MFNVRNLFFIFIALVALVLVACGGGGGPRMTVEEYAAACEEVSNKFDDVGGMEEDLSSGFDAFEDIITEIKRWNPPEELQEFHEVRIRALETSAKLLEDSGILELMREFEKAAEEEDGDRMLELMGEMAELEDVGQELEDKMEELAEEIERTGEGLSPATRQILEDADCISF